MALELIDAAALLWRLRLRDVDVGDRWQAVAENWTKLAPAGLYAFNDLHAAMAFIGAGRSNALGGVLEAQTKAMKGTGDNAAFTRDVGRPATLAFKAFADGDYARCTALLQPVIPIAHRFGGSHTQRDLLDFTLVEAALRGGDRGLARALAAERHQAKPTSRHARTLVARTEAQPS